MREALLIILTFLAFAFLHSVCVTAAVKRLAVRFFGPELVRAFYRLIYTVLSLVTTIAAVIFIFSLPDREIISIPAPLAWILRLLQLAAFAFFLSSFRVIDIMEFTGVRQAWLFLTGREVVGDVEGIRQGSIQKIGAYGIVRHPMYSAAILFILFSPDYSRSWIVVRALSIVYFVFGAIIEERRLKETFGREYLDYMNEVPMIVPGIRKSR